MIIGSSLTRDANIFLWDDNVQANIKLRYLEFDKLSGILSEIKNAFGEIFEAYELLSQSEKSVVLSAIHKTSSVKVVIKKFLFARDYYREWEGYQVFKGGPIPRLLMSDDERTVLIIEFVFGKRAMVHELTSTKVISAYAEMHNQALENMSTLGGVYEERLSADYCITSNEKALNFSGICVGDVKPEHILIAEFGVVIIDLETFHLGRSCLLDIIHLCMFSSNQFQPASSQHHAVKDYVSARRFTSNPYNDDAIVALVKEGWLQKTGAIS